MIRYLPVLLLLLVQHFECYSSDRIEEKKRQHKELETNIRRLFSTQKAFIPAVLRLRDDELLCKCNHFESCGKTMWPTSLANSTWTCAVPAAADYCSRVLFRNNDGTIREVVTSCVHREQLLPRERPDLLQNFPSNLVLLNKRMALTTMVGHRRPSICTFCCCSWSPCCSPAWAFVLAFSIHRKSRRCLTDCLAGWCHAVVKHWTGAGAPMLAERTMARQITLKNCIGRGGFGDVHLGEWRNEPVAVKIFMSRKELSWRRETEIYRNNMLRHPNLLRWITSDNKDTGTSTQLWLITEYLPNGSLYEHLEKHTLTAQAGLQFIRSIAHGLAYLHTEVSGLTEQYHKPAIAHGDLKSGNILIKNDWTCCIADLGMGICFAKNQIDKPKQGDKGGTARYLAPEFLTNTFNHESFNAYLQMDIYALALVIWEICRRMSVPTDSVPSFPYQVPYWEYVHREPSPDEMAQCVCVEGRRPSIPVDWSNSKILSELTRIIEESWSAVPQSRLTALHIRCTLDRICAEENVRIIT
uniref:receptor protein serine/threonine kinase n=1 Tax=Globodera rostochiensis TaxID=31243 RepID=A0A914GTL7_GLORO